MRDASPDNNLGIIRQYCKSYWDTFCERASMIYLQIGDSQLRQFEYHFRVIPLFILIIFNWLDGSGLLIFAISVIKRLTNPSSLLTIGYCVDIA